MHKHVQALIKLKPNSSFVWKDEEDFSTLVYRTEESDVPTFDEIKAQAVKDETEYTNNKYQRDRAADYPSWQEQMDLLYHGGVDALKAELKKTKDKFPKPS